MIQIAWRETGDYRSRYYGKQYYYCYEQKWSVVGVTYHPPFLTERVPNTHKTHEHDTWSGSKMKALELSSIRHMIGDVRTRNENNEKMKPQ